MKNKFRIVALLLVACMAFMFAGCDLFSKNSSAYYNQIVISVNYGDGSKIEINRRDFLTAYNNYGQNLISQYGYTEEKAQEATVDALVNRKILLKEAKKVAKTAEGSSVELTDLDKKDLRYQTYESLLSNARDYEDDIRDSWGETKEEEMKKDTSSDTTVYTPYEKKARPVYDKETKQYRIELIKDDTTKRPSKIFNSLDEIYTAFVNETKNNSEDKYAREEYRRYVASLQASQKVLQTNYTEEELVKNEIKRIYENLEDNEYITKYQDYKQENGGYSTITVAQVLDKYKSMISVSKFKYENDLDSFNSDMLEKRENVNYFVNDDYFYVAHILIKFSDEQQAEYDSLENLSNKGQGDIISAEQYEQQKSALYSNIKASVRDAETGEITATDTVLAKDVLKEVQVALSNATTKETKDEAFRKLMYKYNEDGGIMNATYPYVIGENDSKMVENFTDASRELNDAGTYGAISGLVESEYGLHIIYYMGKCENPYTIPVDNKIDLRDTYIKDEGTAQEQPYSDVLMLDEYKLNNLNNKTLFDLIFEGLSNDNYSQFESMNLNTMKETYQIQVTVVKNLI